LGTLIRHAAGAAAAAKLPLPVAVILPPLDAFLMAAIGRAKLLASHLITTRIAAIALSSVATGADREQLMTVRIAASP
jgi:hypothetical protein